jgi:hypothetical protein
MLIKQIYSLPCPWCGTEIDLSWCRSRSTVRFVLGTDHLYSFRGSCKCREKNKWDKIDCTGGLAAWREALIKDRQLPCPHCHAVMNTDTCRTDPDVRHVANTHSSVCPSWPGYELVVGKKEAVEMWIAKSQEIWRDKSPTCTLLTDKQLRAAHSRGGRHQLKRDKRRGGNNQDIEDKRRGGSLAMHNRWHVAKGIQSIGCKLCYPATV